MQKCPLAGLAMLIAAFAAPRLAAAQTMLPAGIHHATAIGSVNLRQLARSAANIAMLKAKAAHPVEMPRHRYPATSQRLAPALPVMGTANVAIARTAGPGARSGGFTGLYGGANAAATGSDLEPPDQGLAVNNGQVAEIVNDVFQVFDAKGKPLSNPISAHSLLAVDASAGLGDPHVEFDPATQRWYIDGYLATNSFNGFALAVSNTADPLGVYVIYKVDADTANIPACQGSCFPDYPQVGYDANGFYIAADLFSNVTGGFVGAAVYALPQSQLTTGAPLSYQYFLFNDFVVEPAIPAVPGKFATEAGGTEYFLTARQIYNGSDTLRVYAITNTAAIAQPTGLVAHSATLTGEAYSHTVPSTEPNDVGPYGQSVGATRSPTLDGGYNSFGSGVKYLKGNLYAALASGSLDGNGLKRDVIAWFKVAATATPSAVTASIANQGYIVPPNGYSLSYPGLALDAKGNGILGTTITNPDASAIGGYPSAGFVRFGGGMPGSTYKVSGQGTASDDGFSGYNGATASVGRWGDFSSATVDPATGLFYVGNEFIPNDYVYPRTQYENWGTFITTAK